MIVNKTEYVQAYLSNKDSDPEMYEFKHIKIITWDLPNAEMVIGWSYSHDLFNMSWQSLHKVMPIVITEESRMFLCGFHCFSSIITLDC